MQHAVASVHAIVDEGLGNASYLVEPGQGLALVVDPARDPLPYLRQAEQRGLRIAWVAETHLHADFVSGARELARAGARVLAPRAAKLAFPHPGLGDGDQVDLGGLSLRALATPGHPPEHVSYPLLAAPDEDAFVRALLEGLGSYPPHFLRLREVNRRGPALYGPRPPALAPLDPPRVGELLADGAELIDARPIQDFAAGHINGAVSIQLRPAFATWLGWLVPEDRRLVFVRNTDQDRDDLVRQCLKVGYERLAGELAGGMGAWRSAGLPEARLEIADVADQAGGTVLDVRQDAEFTSGHLPGARRVELGAPASAEGLPVGPLAVMCGHGERAMTGASLLQRASHRDNLTVLVGGPDDWARATGRPLERS